MVSSKYFEETMHASAFHDDSHFKLRGVALQHFKHVSAFHLRPPRKWGGFSIGKNYICQNYRLHM